MPTYNGNNIYLAIDGVQVQALFKKVSLEPSVESVDITRGAGTTDIQRTTGLRDTKFGVTIAYDSDLIQSQIAYLRPGRHTVVFGPEGSGTGKPKHQQDFITSSAPLEVVVEKGEVAFDIKGDGADAPVFDMFTGATF